MSGDLQHTPEWHAERLGKITASHIDDVLAQPRKGAEYSASRRHYKARLVLERLTGKTKEHNFESWEMKRGTELEPIARAAYETRRDCMVDPSGFVDHPRIPMSGCSPDGLVGEEGLLQFKCPNAAQHIEWLSAGKVPTEHVKQMAFELACTGRKWNDFVSYHPDFPDNLQLFIARYHRDDVFIAKIEAEVEKLDAEIEETVRHLRQFPNADLTDQLQQSIHVVRAQKAAESLEIGDDDAKAMVEGQAELERRRAAQPKPKPDFKPAAEGSTLESVLQEAKK